MIQDISIIGDQDIHFPMIGNGGSTPPPFNPDSISGLIFWINSENVVDSEGRAAEFIDLSDSPHTVFPADIGGEIISNAINGLPAVRFTGGHRYDLNPSLSNASATIFIVAAGDTVSSPAYAPFIIGANFRVVVKTGTGSNWGTFIGSDLVGDTALNNIWHILEMTSTAGACHLILDGIEENSAAGASTGTGGVSSIGGESAFARELFGDIAEILVYDNVVSNENRTLIRSYLEGKYL